MNTAEKPSLHLKHSVYLVSAVEVGWTALMKEGDRFTQARKKERNIAADTICPQPLGALMQWKR